MARSQMQTTREGADRPISPRTRRRQRPVGPQYHWVVLSNTTLGALLATINSSILLMVAGHLAATAWL